MTEGQVALYARVSSDQQAEANTIDSQVAALRERIVADGVDLRSVLEFIDAGYSGSSLVRPALERLRDVAAAGGIDRLYVHCPDRFARHYAYQVLLLDELTQRGGGGPLSQSPPGAHAGRSVAVTRARHHCGVRAGQISRTKPTRQAACRASRARRSPVPCPLRLPVCAQAGRRRRRTL
jgi:Resolvase, N terminal domain